MKIFSFLIAVILAVIYFHYDTNKPQANHTEVSEALSDDYYWLTEEENKWLCDYKNSYKGKPPSSIKLPTGKIIHYKWERLQSGKYKGSLAAEPLNL